MTSLVDHFRSELDGLKSAGLYKTERVITGKQAGTVALSTGRDVINLCANNYLGLSDNAELIAAGQAALDRYGYGMSSVRFICGTQEVHTELEARISKFLGFEDTILYSSCFDANTGLFETILGPEDAIISDALNHASIIDGVRLCKAARYRYANSDMGDLEAKPEGSASGSRFRLIATDGVFSMDGYIATLVRDLRFGGSVRCHGYGRRKPRSWISWSHRARQHRTLRRNGSGRHRDRHPWEGAWWGFGRVHQRQGRGDRLASPTLAPLPVFQHPCSSHRGHFDQGAGHAGGFDRNGATG